MDGFNLEIEWDQEKAQANIRKHDVSFALAATVLRDPFALTTPDDTHSEVEERWITIGRTLNGTCLMVVHTWVEIDANHAKARIISARQAQNPERRQYEEGL